MAKEEFLQNLRAARNWLSHRVEATFPGLNPDDIERSLARAAIWLTPKSVEGFDAADFPELDGRARDELARSVTEFRRVAEQVPPDGPATNDELERATTSFLSILRILEPYLPSGEEANKLRRGMKNVRFPAGVLTWEFEFGRDSTLDPAVWIWIVVDDRTANSPGFPQLANQLQREVREVLRAAGIDRWPYVRFRTASEQRELQAAGR